MVLKGFMTKVESKHYTKAIGKTDINLYWLPGLWFVHNLQEAQRQGLVNDPLGVKLIMQVNCIASNSFD